MRIDVLENLRLRLVCTVAAAGLAGMAAGCSSDVSRFDDGFYTGAVPQAPLTQSASLQPYPGDLDRTSTGGIQAANNLGAPSYPSAPGGYQQPGASAAYGNAPTSSVQSNQLPPPPSPTYMAQPSQPSQSNTMVGSPQSALPEGRGAPPSTLQEQARRVSTPQARPSYTPSAPSRSSRSGSVTVASGDTLLGIARRTGVSVAEIKQANGMSDDTVRLGQTLVVPGASKTTQVASVKPSAPAKTTVDAKPAVAPESTPAAAPAPYTPPKTAEKSARPVVETAAVEAPAAASPAITMQAAAEEKVAVAAPTATGINGFRWPAQGRVVNRFGEKVGSRRNDGLNISVPRGTPIKAAENGVVIYAGDGLKEFGNTVLVQHDDGLVTVYGHADKLEVKRGAKVARGQEIATSGMSGDTDVPIVHFEVRKNSTPVDPTKYLQ